MQRLTAQFGILFYRYRLANYAAAGLRVRDAHGYLIERVDELPRVAEWVSAYSERLRTAANA